MQFISRPVDPGIDGSQWIIRYAVWLNIGAEVKTPMLRWPGYFNQGAAAWHEDGPLQAGTLHADHQTRSCRNTHLQQQSESHISITIKKNHLFKK